MSEASRSRKRVAAIGLVLGPFVFAVADLLRLSVDAGAESERDLLAAVAAEPGRWQVAGLLNITGVVLLLPAVLGLMHLLRARSTRMSHLGGALALIGVLGWAAHFTRYFGFYQAAASSEVDRDEIVVLIEQWTANPDTAVYVLMFVLAYPAGLLILSLGLLRSSTGYRWASVSLLLGAALYLPLSFTPLAENLVAVGINQALLVLGLVGTGAFAWRLSDADWEAIARH